MKKIEYKIPEGSEDLIREELKHEEREIGVITCFDMLDYIIKKMHLTKRSMTQKSGYTLLTCMELENMWVFRTQYLITLEKLNIIKRLDKSIKIYECNHFSLSDDFKKRKTCTIRSNPI